MIGAYTSFHDRLIYTYRFMIDCSLPKVISIRPCANNIIRIFAILSIEFLSIEFLSIGIPSIELLSSKLLCLAINIRSAVADLSMGL